MLTVTEVALSLVLLIGAGLFLKSFVLIMGMDLGFRTENVLAMNINLPELHYKTAEQRFQFFQDLGQREARCLVCKGSRSPTAFPCAAAGAPESRLTVSGKPICRRIRRP